MKKKCVVDASVILKFLLHENAEVANKFEGLLTKAQEEKIEILSHPLMILEVANGLRFTLKDQAQARETLKIVLRLPFKILPLTEIQQEKTLEMSFGLGTTVYDTSYHILAKSHGAVFITCDREYFKKAKQLKDIELWR